MKLSVINPISPISCAVAAIVIAFALGACGQEPPPKPAAKAAPPAATPAPAPEAKVVPAPKPVESAQATADKDLAAKVKAALIAEPGINAHGIDVVAKEGIVTLFGTTTTRERRDRAEKVATQVAGVKQVENKLAVVAGS